MRKHRRFFLFPLASRKKDHRIMFYFLYRHLTLWSQFAKGTFLPAWGSDWHIEHSTSNDQDFPRQRLSKEWLYAIAAFYGFAHTHTQKHQPKNIICPHTFFTNFTTPSVTVEAPNVQCQGLSLSVCAGNQGLWQVLSSQIPWTSQQFRSFTQLPRCLANWGVSSYPNVGSLSSLKNSWMQFWPVPGHIRQQQ